MGNVNYYSNSINSVVPFQLSHYLFWTFAAFYYFIQKPRNSLIATHISCVHQAVEAGPISLMISSQYPEEFTLLTMLLRLLSILNNDDGDISMCNYAKIKEKESNPSAPTELQTSEFKVLDAMSAILVWNWEVVSSCYQNGTRHITNDGERILPIKLVISANPERDPNDARHFGVRVMKKGRSVWLMVLEKGAFHSWK
jgi:hypothetical protein